MQIKVTGRGMDITPAIRDYTHDKVAKLEALFSNIQKVEVVIEARANVDANQRQTAEVRAWMAGHKIIQAIEAGRDAYAAIDLVIEEAKRQVVKHKSMLVHENRRKSARAKQDQQAAVISSAAGQEDREGLGLVRLSTFAKKPMRQEEAVEQLKALGQEFLAFRNSKTKEVNVVRKNDNDIELLRAEKEMSEEDALTELKETGDNLIFFNNTSTKIPAVIFKRKSGSFGLIEPEI